VHSEVERRTIDWREFAITPSDGSKIVLVHTVLWSDDFKKVLAVLNREELNFQKPRGWGIPTGKVNRPSPDGSPGRSPLEQAKFEIISENNIENNDFRIHRIPVDASIAPNGRFHLVFTGILEPFTEIPPNPVDPDGDILEATLVDPDSDIDQKDSEPRFRGNIFYKSHLRYILTARNRFPAGEIIV